MRHYPTFKSDQCGCLPPALAIIGGHASSKFARDRGIMDRGFTFENAASVAKHRALFRPHEDSLRLADRYNHRLRIQTEWPALSSLKQSSTGRPPFLANEPCPLRAISLLARQGKRDRRLNYLPPVNPPPLFMEWQ